MKKIGIITALLLLVGYNLMAQNLIMNPDARCVGTLNGKWNYIVDPYETGYLDYRLKPYDAVTGDEGSGGGGYYVKRKLKSRSERIEYDFDLSPTIEVPGDWNSQKPELWYYEGTIWYHRQFKANPTPGKRQFIWFGGANYETDVYVNGKKKIKHIGGFTPFNCEVTDDLKNGDNYVICRVNNVRHRSGVPTVNTDWWNFGGLTRDILMVEVPETFIESYHVQLKKGSDNIIEGYVQLNGKNATQKVTISIPEAKTNVSFTTDQSGKGTFSVKAKKLTLWSDVNPKLYAVTIQSETDKVDEKIGFRTIEVKGTDILLNGKSVFLRGICAHEEIPMRSGRAFSEADAKTILSWANELNANFMRLAHYPHSRHMARLADELGMLLWEEIPVYWTIDWENAETYKNAENQLDELVARDRNRASVIIWSMANETPTKPARLTFLKNLATKARTLDDTRLISAALEINHDESTDKLKLVNDPFGEFTDVASFNEYIGWYSPNDPTDCHGVEWNIIYNKPIIISEFGAGATYGFHADSLTRWTEEYQAWLYRETFKMLEKIDALRGITPWILTDFHTPKRNHPVYQQQWNRKGLLSERGDKKLAFFELRKYLIKKEKEYLNK